jgi:hypothetical protein
MAIVVNTTLKADTKDAVKQVEVLKKEVEKVGKAAKKSGEDISAAMQIGNEATRGLDKATGGLASKLLKVGKAAKLSGKAMKTALISSGIGAAVVAIGLLVEYWDEIKGLVDGVNSEQATLLKTTEDTLAAQQEQLATTGSMENTLKLQGKTEKEIRDLKRQQTDEIIASTELLLEQQKQVKIQQIEAAERNKNIATGIIAFLSTPILLITGLIDGITNSLVSLGILSEGTSLTVDYLDKTSSLLFDPEEVEKEGEATIAATEETLIKLKNTRDGYLLKDKENAKKAANDIKNTEIEAEKERAAAIERIRKGLIDTEAEERAEKLRQIKEDYDQQIALAAEFYGANSIKILELKAAQKLAEDEQQAVFDEQDKARKEKIAADAKAAEELRQKTIREDLEEQARIDKEAAEYKENEYQDGYANLQNIVSTGGKKLEAVSKGLAIADIARSSFKSISSTVSATGEANAKAVAASPLTSGMPFVGINTLKAALSIGSTLASAKKSISAITGNSKSPSGSSPSPSGGGGGSQPPAFNVVGASGETQLADAIGSQTQRPSKSYVVANDVTTAQEMDRNIIEGASIG